VSRPDEVSGRSASWSSLRPGSRCRADAIRPAPEEAMGGGTRPFTCVGRQKGSFDPWLCGV
jgi:hypothetical protein